MSNEVTQSHVECRVMDIRVAANCHNWVIARVIGLDLKQFLRQQYKGIFYVFGKCS
jgi:hypothetical protein